jgi:hypothetical protein
MNCISHTVVENLKQFAFKGDKSRVVRRTFWLIKVVPTWKKFGKRWLRLQISCGSKKNEPRYACLSEAKASHSHSMWTEKSSSVPYLLHTGLLVIPIKWRRHLSLLCPARRPVATLDGFLLKDNNLVFVAGLGPEISYRACPWALLRPHHISKCWLTTQRFIFLFMFCLKSLNDGSGPTNFRTEPSLASMSAISFPRTPACPVTQYSPTLCRLEISFNVFWHCCTSRDVVLAAWRAFRAFWLS